MNVSHGGILGLSDTEILARRSFTAERARDVRLSPKADGRTLKTRPAMRSSIWVRALEPPPA